MKKNSKKLYEEINDFFDRAPTTNQKAWGLINEFYHLVLTYMEKNNISKAELARRLGKSRSAITQMFNKTPNVTIKKMVEISDSIGLTIDITSKQLQKEKNTYIVQINYVFPYKMDNWEYVPEKKLKIENTYTKSQKVSLFAITPTDY